MGSFFMRIKSPDVGGLGLVVSLTWVLKTATSRHAGGVLVVVKFLLGSKRVLDHVKLRVSREILVFLSIVPLLRSTLCIHAPYATTCV